MSVKSPTTRFHEWQLNRSAQPRQAALRRYEQRRVVLTKHGREDHTPMPMQAARCIKRASTVQDEGVAAPGLLSRMVALLRG
jgi:hypothetical protein